jgi:hypothetical protein
MPNRRHVYMVLSPRSLRYSGAALESLFRNSIEPIQLRLITDSKQDKKELSDAVAAVDAGPHQWAVNAEENLAEREEALFGATTICAPCWRKITDPLLLYDLGAKLVLLDPDFYFLNRFQFVETPPSGLLLMRQRPNCLFPPDVVRLPSTKGYAWRIMWISGALTCELLRIWTGWPGWWLKLAAPGYPEACMWKRSWGRLCRCGLAADISTPVTGDAGAARRQNASGVSWARADRSR